MAERKKRGLGRGLGALIPDANSNDRPVDVFFSGGNSEDGKRESETKTSRTARTDPAASMQSSRRRKPKASGTTRSPSTTSGADTETEAAASKTASSKAGSAKAGSAKSGTAKAASSTSSKNSGSKPAGSKSTATKSTTSKSTGTKTTASKTTGTKASTSKSSAPKTSAPKAAGNGSSRTSAPAESTASKSKSGSSVQSRSGSSSDSPVESADKAPAAPKKHARKTSSPDAVSDAATGSGDVETAAASSSSDSTSVQVADNEAVDVSSDLVNDSQVPEATSATASASSAEDDVRETHPGVYTSSGRSHADNEADEEGQSGLSGVDDHVATTNVVESEAVDALDETRPVAASESEPSTASESDNGTSSSASIGQPGDSGTVETADEGELDDFEGVESIPDTEFGEIDVDLIDANPRQPRTVFDEDLLAELVHSIREIGVLQPVVVRQKPSDRSRFELIMGERRLRATKDAGLSTIPAIIRYVEDTDLLRDALLENLHRAELNPLEEAAAYGQLLEDFGCTQEELSERIGRSRPQISNTLRLLRLPPLVQRRVAAGVISAGHARAILGLRDPEHMEVLAQRIVAEGLSVRASEEAVVLLNRGDSINVSRATTKVSPEFLAVAERLGDRLDTKVNISVGKRKGKLSVEFANQEDLDRILGLLGIPNEDAL